MTDTKSPTWDERDGAARKWLNEFAENWIFAIVIAMAIRHFFFEIYGIPTASMEPMMYGSQRFVDSDKVVVSKLTARFSNPERYDVTVFEFPVPELGPLRSPVPAWDLNGERHDALFINPLMHRNFVKRCLMVPGDVFYFYGGDPYVQQADDSFAIPLKPRHIQDAVWQPIYRLSDAPDYQAWQFSSAAHGAVRYQDGLHMNFAQTDGRLQFMQQLNNSFFKAGEFRVAPARLVPRLKNGVVDLQQVHELQRQGRLQSKVVSVAMTKPLFDFAGYDRQQCNIWQRDQWEVFRLSTADIDKVGVGDAVMSHVAREHVGDFRVTLDLARLQGTVRIHIDEGSINQTALELTATGGWSLISNHHQTIRGDWALDEPISFVYLDNRLWVEQDGTPLHDMVMVEPSDPNVVRPRLYMTGEGEVVLQDLEVSRDIHYSQSGFMTDMYAEYQAHFHAGLGGGYTIKASRAAFVDALADESLKQQLQQLQASPRQQWLRQPIGVSPQTAIRVPEGAYLLMGDNSIHSWDSRNWGWVPAANVRGKVMAAFFPRLKVIR